MGLELFKEVDTIDYQFLNDNIISSKLSKVIATMKLSKIVIPQKFNNRPDLLSGAIYRRKDLDWLVLLTSGKTKDTFTEGSIIKVVPPNKISEILT